MERTVGKQQEKREAQRETDRLSQGSHDFGKS